MGRANRSLDIVDELVDLVDAGDDVGPHLLGVRVPGIAELPLISLVDLMSPDEEHEGGHDGQVVGNQRGLTKRRNCW